ncbi:hypothetical protein GCM10023146_07210 [Nocardioides caricicola]
MVLVTLSLTLATAIWLARAAMDSGAASGSWAEGVAHVGADQFSVAHDDWTYGSGLSVMSWIDSSGTWHDHGVPACLRVKPGTSVPVRFQAREVTVEQQTWRPIVAVDCR